jgi:predicted nucleotidyltransferase
MNGKHLTKEIKQYLNTYLNDSVDEVILFGSQVNGTANKDSDYDVVIILKTEDDLKTRKLVNDYCYDIDLKYNIFLDTQIITKEELNQGLRGKHPVFELAVKEGIHA